MSTFLLEEVPQAFGLDGNEDIFIGWDIGVCSFDSERFKAMLKYVSQFPDDPTGGSQGYCSLGAAARCFHAYFA